MYDMGCTTPGPRKDREGRETADRGAKQRGRVTRENIPCRFLLRILHDTFGMRAGCTPMGVLVVLVEGIRAPKNTVAVWTGVALVAFVKLILVPLPVKLALEGDVAEGAPVSALGFRAA